MTDNHRADSHLDAAIDRAVREMMSVEPRADLRARVLAELAGEPLRTLWWPRLALGSAAVAVAVVLMLMMVSRPIDRPVDQTIVSAPPSATTPEVKPRPASPPAGSTPTVADGARSRAGDRQPGPVSRGPVIEDRPVQAASIDNVDTVEAIGVEPMTPVERLRPIDPIGMATLDTPQVSTPTIDIKPITIEPIEITPLTPRR